MKIVIITGMSGSGKSEAMNIMEDLGYYCVDNLPPALISKFILLSQDSKGTLDKIALGVDVRGHQLFLELNSALDYLDEGNYDYKIIFLDARDDILVRRYKMSRRKHPLSDGDDLIEGIARERKMLSDMKNRSDYSIDTSSFLPIDLRNEILNIFSENKKKNITITCMSFGFKYGIPIDSDLVFDVRFLPNPYYIQELKPKSGNHKEVSDYVMDSIVSVEFLKRLIDFISYLIPNYIKEGKNHLVIAIGCTGGRHRSVTIANKVYEKIKSDGYKVYIKHRDIDNK